MAKLLEKHEAAGKVKDILEEIEKTFGKIPNFFKAIAAADADWLELCWHRHKVIMQRESALNAKEKELIALAVSLANRCEYCSVAHEQAAKMQGANEAEITDLKKVVELFSSFSSIADSLRVPIQ